MFARQSQLELLQHTHVIPTVKMFVCLFFREITFCKSNVKFLQGHFQGAVSLTQNDYQ